MTNLATMAQSGKCTIKIFPAFNLLRAASVVVCCIVLAAPDMSVGSQVPDFTAGTIPVTATNPPQPMMPAEINIALRNTSNLIASSNLLDAATQASPSIGPGFQFKLEQGRKQKRDEDFAGAEKSFIGLLESDAPPEIQRTALLELALLAQETENHARAQQIFSQYLTKYPDDPSVAEVMLRQGLLYRQMGAPILALSKFYSVMTTSLRLKLDRLEYYQRLVLQAQTEIADTYYLQGKFEEAADFLNRLLKLDSSQLNKGQILYKLVRSLSARGRHPEVVAQAEIFVTRYPGAGELPEVRFLLADALKKLGRTREGMQQVLALLESQQTNAASNPENWTYWQQRTGNEIANQLYKEGDYVNALEIYRNLAELNRSAAWQLPAWYQMGLAYERLLQPQKASEAYQRILDRQKELDSAKRSPSLATVIEMAQWRKDHLQWLGKAEQATASLSVSGPVLEQVATSTK
jgi:tetratricopeptide (TPR) repeat protein